MSWAQLAALCGALLSAFVLGEAVSKREYNFSFVFWSILLVLNSISVMSQ